VAWVRSGDAGPGRTFRYDLELGLAMALRPRVVRVVRMGVEETDPADPVARDAAFARNEAPVDQVAAREGVVEAATEIAEAQAPRASVGAVRQALVPMAAGGSPRAALLAAWARAEEAGEPYARVVEARKLVPLAAACSLRWQHFASWQLAHALIGYGEYIPRAQRLAAFAEARALLEGMLRPARACCGEALVTWKLANLIVRMRADLADPAALVAARAEGRRLLDDLTALRSGFVHRGADVLVQELPGYFASLWKARAAVGLQTQNGMSLIVSVLEDGSEAIAHLESTQFLGALGFRSDGGGLYAGALEWVTGIRRMGLWDVALDGLTLTSLSPRPLSVAPPRDWYASGAVLPHPGGDGALIAGASLDPSTPAGDLSSGLVGLTAVPPERTGLWVDGSRRIQLPPDGFTTLNGVSFTWSPDGDTIALVSRDPGGSTLTLRLIAHDALKGGRVPGAVDLDGSGAAGGGAAPVVVTLPGWDAESVTNPSWARWPGAEWIAAAHAAGGGSAGLTVRFLDPRDPTRTVDRLVPVVDFGSDSLRWTESCLVREPPLCLIAAGTQLHAMDIPPAGPALRVLPVGLAGQLENVSELRVPPWGEVAFFTAARRGSAADSGESRTLFAMNLRSGVARAMVGPGSTFPLTRRLSHVAVSPVPERR
jgi:hypothetical protein